MFYYKFNLLYEEFDWFGSKLVKKKFFISTMVKKYQIKKISQVEIGLSFSKKKYSNIFCPKWWLAFYLYKKSLKI